MNRFLLNIGITILMLSFIGVKPGDCASKTKWRIKHVAFQGNKIYSNQQILKVMISRPSRFLQPSHFFPMILQDDLKAIEDFYNQNGYLQARIESHEVVRDSLNRCVSIDIKIYEGELTRVGAVSLFGYRFFPEKALLSKIKFREGEPFKRKEVETTTMVLLSMYADNGFLEAEITPNLYFSENTRNAFIDFVIIENTQSFTDSIKITGLKKTKPRIVKRELSFKESELINYSELLKSQRRLYLTGLFQSVFIRAQMNGKADSSRKNILVEANEKKSGELNVSVGYESIEKLRGRIEIFNTNLQGNARKIGLSGKLSFINYKAEASFTDPYTFRTRWKTDMRAFIEYLEDPGYNLERSGIVCVVGRSFFQRSSTTLTYRNENVNLDNIRVSNIPKIQQSDVSSLKYSIILDTRDNLFNATKGFYGEMSDEFAGSFLGGNNQFNRITGKFKYYKKVKSNYVGATSLGISWIYPFETVEKIPLNERLYAGGPNSIRAFEYKKVGPLDDRRNPYGGTFSLIWNVFEIRRSIYKMIGGVIFVDAGNVWTTPDEFSLRSFRHAIGAGVRVNTPIGLARLDYGMNFNRKAGESSGKIYFSMGHAF